MKKPLQFFTAFLLFLAGTASAQAQIDTIRVKDKRLNTSALKPGLRQYLVYYQSPKKPKNLSFWLWTRNVKKETRNAEPVFTISQQWFGSDTSMYRSVYSVNRASDFLPVYHAERSVHGIRAYNWTEKKIGGADTVTDNVHKAFSLDFKEANYNWNLDIETFEMLPLATDKTFAVNFYDAAIDVPKYVLYKVIGSEELATLDGKKVDCWKLYTEGSAKGGDYNITFWISKNEHEFLKEENFYAGQYGYKVKLPLGASDFLPKFSK